MPQAPAAVPLFEQKTVQIRTPVLAARPVEVIPGRHLVANANGTVILVAHREPGPLTARSIAARQLSALVEIVRRAGSQQLASTVSQLKTVNGAVVDFGIVRPTPAGLDVFMYGAVTAVLDNGVRQTLLHGLEDPRGLHRSVPVPTVAVVMTVDEAGKRLSGRPHHTGVYTLSAGTVPGQGAVVWSTQPASAPTRTPAVAPPARGGGLSAAPAVQVARPMRWVTLDDNSRFDVERDCVIGRDPYGSDAVTHGLRPVRIDDRSGEMSRAHAEIRLVEGQVFIVDRGSTNGVFLREPGQQDWTRIPAWQPARWRSEASVQIGSRILRLQEQPAQRPPRRPGAHLHRNMPEPWQAGPHDRQHLRNAVAPRRSPVARDGHAPNGSHGVGLAIRPYDLPKW
jgi:RND superfamily putative drug exporter